MSLPIPSPAQTATSDAPAPTSPGPSGLPEHVVTARRRAMSAHPAGSFRGGSSSRDRRLAPVPAPLSLPTTDEVHRLAKTHHPVSLSVLLSTVPAARMTSTDHARLQALVREAERRLADEPDRRSAQAVRAGLATAAARAASGPTDRGLALLVSPEGAHAYHLRVRPQDRVVLDPTFATRDLVRSTSEDPAFLLLVIDGRAARLFHYDQRYCRPVLGHDFPVLRPAATLRDRAAIGSIDRVRREQLRAFLRDVDARLAGRLAEAALPVVLVATERIAAEYLAQGRGRRIAAVVGSGRTRLPLSELENLGRAALADHVSDRAAAALDAVHARLRQGRAVAGLAAAWEAMLRCDPDVLVVERSYSAAVRVEGAGFSLADDPHEPGVIDDAVDELIEAVLARGGQVVAVPDGALVHQGCLIVATRTRVGRAR